MNSLPIRMLFVTSSESLRANLLLACQRVLADPTTAVPECEIEVVASLRDVKPYLIAQSADVCLVDAALGDPVQIEQCCQRVRRRFRVPAALVFSEGVSEQTSEYDEIPLLFSFSPECFSRDSVAAKLDAELVQLLRAVTERRILKREIERDLRRERFLKELACSAADFSPQEAQEQLGLALAGIANEVHVEGAALWLLSEDETLLSSHVSSLSRDVPARFSQTIRAKNLSSFLSNIEQSGQARILDTTELAELSEHDSREFSRQGMRSVYGVSLESEERLTGVLVLHASKPILSIGYLEEVFLREVSGILSQCLARLGKEATLSKRSESLESTMRDAEAKFRNVIESLMEGIIICDSEGVVQYSNYRFSQITGLGKDTIEGKLVSDVYYPKNIRERVSEAEEEYQDFTRRMAQRYQDRLNGRAEQYEVRIFSADAEQRWLETKAGPLRDNLGEVVGSIGVIADVTEQRSLEEQLRWSQKMEAVGRLAGGVAHDFNNLLTVISGYAGMVLSGLEPGAKHYRRIEAIKEATEAACTLTQQLLTVSRKQVVQPKILNLNETLEHTIGIVRGLLGDDIELRTSLSPNLPSIKIDPGQIQQVIMNLAINARDAMADGGTLRLLTNTQFVDNEDYFVGARLDAGDYVVLRVSDTGAGMSDTVKEHLFEPFFTTKSGGTGLGLSTIYGIIKQAGGDITVQSEQGAGTRFTIYFPVQESASKVAASETSSVAVRGRGVILLVEDELHVRSLVREVLEDTGYTVVEAAHGGEALEYYAKHGEGIDLILSDISMPHVNGVELTERVRSKSPEQRILLMSGCTQDSAMPESIVRMKLPFLPKPFGPEVLAEKVATVLGLNSKQDVA